MTNESGRRALPRQLAGRSRGIDVDRLRAGLPGATPKCCGPRGAAAAGGTWSSIASWPRPSGVRASSWSASSTTALTSQRHWSTASKPSIGSPALLDEEDWRAGAADRVARVVAQPRISRSSTRHWPLVARAQRSAQERRERGQRLRRHGWPVDTARGDRRSVCARVFELGAEGRRAAGSTATRSATAVDLRLYDFQSYQGPLVPSRSCSPSPSAIRCRSCSSACRGRDTPGAPRRPALRRWRCARYVADLASLPRRARLSLRRPLELDGLCARTHFEVGDHLSPSGRALFMPVLDAALEPYLPARGFVATN